MIQIEEIWRKQLGYSTAGMPEEPPWWNWGTNQFVTAKLLRNSLCCSKQNIWGSIVLQNNVRLNYLRLQRILCLINETMALCFTKCLTLLWLVASLPPWLCHIDITLQNFNDLDVTFRILNKSSFSLNPSKREQNDFLLRVIFKTQDEPKIVTEAQFSCLVIKKNL